jgi:O-antigen ligase
MTSRSSSLPTWSWTTGSGLGLILALVAVAVGALAGFAGPLIAVAVLLGLAVAAVMVRRLAYSLYAMIAVITLLPYGSLPVRVVFTPTFLDLAMASALAIYLLQWMNGSRRTLALTPVHGPLLVFITLTVFAFVAGLPNGPLTSNLIRQFAELLLSMSFVLLLTDVVRGAATLTHLTRAMMWGGALAAAIGIVLYLLPVDQTNALLSVLRPFGYPSGEVVRYIEDNPANAQRAIATAIDPNALGGLLAMIGALLAPQVVAERPTAGPRWLVAGMFVLVGVCVVLTFSRGAMAALAAGLLVIAGLRYRRLLLVMGAAAILIAVLPVTQGYVERFVAGLQGADLATQMRFGEYDDALRLISRYPLFGVGFSGTPTRDLYLGVSNAYLLMATQMGLVGLAAFGMLMASIWVWCLSRWPLVRADLLIAPQWLGLLAGLTAALTVGLVDHYFFNLDFQSAGALFWTFIGLLLAATRLAGSREVSRVSGEDLQGRKNH